MSGTFIYKVRNSILKLTEKNILLDKNAKKQNNFQLKYIYGFDEYILHFLNLEQFKPTF